MADRAGPLVTEMSEQKQGELSSTFNIEGLKKVIDLYKERKYIEDITYINDTLGGVNNILKGL